MNLILNEPCGVDAFFGGGGNGSARVVADWISDQLRNPSQLTRSDGSDCGYPVSIIGLNGCFGCGNSCFANAKLSKQRLLRFCRGFCLSKVLFLRRKSFLRFKVI